jgi:hypothetical protein
LEVAEPRMQEFAEFRETWNIDFPEEQLTDRKHKQESGWISKGFFPLKFRRKIEDRIETDELSDEFD